MSADRIELWACRCGHAGAHPADRPSQRRKWHAGRAGHSIERTAFYDQLTLAEHYPTASVEHVDAYAEFADLDARQQ